MIIRTCRITFGKTNN